MFWLAVCPVDITTRIPKYFAEIGHCISVFVVFITRGIIDFSTNQGARMRLNTLDNRSSEVVVNVGIVIDRAELLKTISDSFLYSLINSKGVPFIIPFDYPSFRWEIFILQVISEISTT